MRTKRHKHASSCIKEVIYVFGGWILNQYSNCVDYLVIGSGNWQRGPDMPVAVENCKVAQLNGCVYLLDAGNSNQLLKLDPEKKVWIKCARLSGKMWRSVSMASVNGKLCVAGGKDACAWYDPNTETWCRNQKPMKEHYGGSLVYYNNTLLLMGGQDNIDIEEYNTEVGSWTMRKMKMPAACRGHHAMVLNIPQEDWAKVDIQEVDIMEWLWWISNKETSSPSHPKDFFVQNKTSLWIYHKTESTIDVSWWNSF